MHHWATLKWTNRALSPTHPGPMVSGGGWSSGIATMKNLTFLLTCKTQHNNTHLQFKDYILFGPLPHGWTLHIKNNIPTLSTIQCSLMVVISNASIYVQYNSTFGCTFGGPDKDCCREMFHFIPPPNSEMKYRPSSQTRSPQHHSITAQRCGGVAAPIITFSRGKNYLAPLCFFTPEVTNTVPVGVWSPAVSIRVTHRTP